MLRQVDLERTPPRGEPSQIGMRERVHPDFRPCGDFGPDQFRVLDDPHTSAIATPVHRIRRRRRPLPSPKTCCGSVTERSASCSTQDPRQLTELWLSLVHRRGRAMREAGYRALTR